MSADAVAGGSFETFLDGLHKRVPNLGRHPLEHVLGYEPVNRDGVVLEFGVYTGSSITKIARRFPERRVFGFDSFEGLPEDWRGGFGKGAFGLGGRMPEVPANVTLVPGWFDATLPAFDASLGPGETVALMHVDCDIYSSTKTIFSALGHRLTDGTVIVFDELFNYPTFEQHEILALFEDLVVPGKFDVVWIGKNGPVERRPTQDNGYWDQPAAIRLVSRA